MGLSVGDCVGSAVAGSFPPIGLGVIGVATGMGVIGEALTGANVGVPPLTGA